MQLFKILIALAIHIPLSSFSEVILEPIKDTDEMTIRIEGEIKSNELNEFVKAYKQIKKNKQKLHLNAIQLNSPGGIMQQGKEKALKRISMQRLSGLKKLLIWDLLARHITWP